MSLGADRKAVRHDDRPPSDARNVRRSHPSPILVQGRTEHVGEFGVRGVGMPVLALTPGPAPILV
jgi:hypothetical protein